MAASRRVVYRDIDLSFKPHPLTGDLPVLKDEQAVKQMVRNTVLTNHFERFGRPLFGGNILAQLFENMDRITLQITKQDIERVVNGLPEIDNVSVSTSAPQTNDRNALEAVVKFRVRNLTIPIDVKLFLGRIR